MTNKVLIKLTMPELDISYDIFIPVNELIWKVKILILKSVEDILKVNSKSNLNYYLINKENNKIYDNNEVVIDTDIRNGSELLLISVNQSN